MATLDPVGPPSEPTTDDGDQAPSGQAADDAYPDQAEETAAWIAWSMALEGRALTPASYAKLLDAVRRGLADPHRGEPA